MTGRCTPTQMHTCFGNWSRRGICPYAGGCSCDQVYGSLGELSRVDHADRVVDASQQAVLGADLGCSGHSGGSAGVSHSCWICMQAHEVITQRCLPCPCQQWDASLHMQPGAELSAS